MTPPLPTDLNRGAVSYVERGPDDGNDSVSWTGRPHTGDRLNRPSLEHTRKRLSFFGRTTSDAPGQKRVVPPTQGSYHLDRPHLRPHPTSQSLNERPSTGVSHTRRKADPIEAIRNTLFGFRNRRKAARENTSEPRRQDDHPQYPPAPPRQHTDTTTNNHADTSLIPFATPSTSEVKPREPKETEFKTEEAFYQHRKKRSISRPFNFQHVTHTASKHLPQLHTVDERDLPGKFWAVNAYQKPKDGLKEIEAEDLLEPVPTQPDEGAHDKPPSTPVGQDETADETTFDETQETNFNPDAFESMHEAKPDDRPSLKTPKHYSSMSALTSTIQKDPDGLRHVIKGRGADEDTGPPGPQRATTSPIVPNVRASMPPKPAPPPESLTMASKENPTASMPSTQRPRQVPSKTSLRTSKNLGQLFPAPPKSDYAGSLHSKRSSRSNATNATRASKKLDLPEPTWEDVIDYAFEQEAEATCDFDWENVSTLDGDVSSEATSGHPSPEDESPAGCSGGVLLSAWLDQPTALKPESSADTPNMSSASTDALSEGSDVVSQPNHKRGTSVGHRGFQAARSRSVSTDAILKTPQHVEFSASSPSTTSPSACADNPLKAALAAADCQKSPFSAAGTQFPALYSRALFREESLSDPEERSSARSSYRRSYRHRRKSSDTGSLQTTSASDVTRWSSASTSSLPDLLHSRRVRSEVRKSRRLSGRALATLPQSPTAKASTPIELPEYNTPTTGPAEDETSSTKDEDDVESFSKTAVDIALSNDHESAPPSEPSLTSDSDSSLPTSSESSSTPELDSDATPSSTSDLTSLSPPPQADFPLPPTPPLKIGPLPPLPPYASEMSAPTIPRRLRPLTTSESRPAVPLTPPVSDSRLSRYRKAHAPRSRSYTAGELHAQKFLSQNQILPAGLDGSPELMMRRPETSGDRALLVSAGRTVQRGRSATPPSRIALGTVEDGGFF